MVIYVGTETCPIIAPDIVHPHADVTCDSISDYCNQHHWYRFILYTGYNVNRIWKELRTGFH